MFEDASKKSGDIWSDEIRSERVLEEERDVGDSETKWNWWSGLVGD